MLRSPFDLDYEASHFRGPAPFPLVSSLNVSWQELVGAVVTVGRWPTDLFAHGQFSFAEAVHRAFCLYAYLKTMNGRLCHTATYESLDPSERGIVSYYLGMAAAKIFASRCLGVPWLMHLSRYGAAWSVTYTTDSRPDLFGFDTAGRWTVAEAKGRARFRTALIGKMQNQKNAVGSINGVTPNFRIGTSTRFRRGDAELRVIDPPADDVPDGLYLDTGLWLRAYYAPLATLMEGDAQPSNDGFVYGSIPGVDVVVGLHEPVVGLVRDRPAVDVPTISPRRGGRPRKKSRTIVAQTNDGLVSWTRELLAAIRRTPEPAQADGIRVKLGEAWALD